MDVFNFDIEAIREQTRGVFTSVTTRNFQYKAN